MWPSFCCTSSVSPPTHPLITHRLITCTHQTHVPLCTCCMMLPDGCSCACRCDSSSSTCCRRSSINWRVGCSQCHMAVWGVWTGAAGHAKNKSGQQHSWGEGCARRYVATRLDCCLVRLILLLLPVPTTPSTSHTTTTAAAADGLASAQARLFGWRSATQPKTKGRHFLPVLLAGTWMGLDTAPAAPPAHA